MTIHAIHGIYLTMVLEQTMQQLVQICRTNKYAKYFFEELAQLKSPKPRIDIDRRRKSINIAHKLNLTREDTYEFFGMFEKLRLGKLEVMKEWGGKNSGFAWTNKDMSPRDLAAEVIKRVISDPTNGSAAPIPIQSGFKTSNGHTNGHSNGQTVAFRLESGSWVQLSMNDIESIQEMAVSLLNK